MPDPTPAPVAPVPPALLSFWAKLQAALSAVTTAAVLWLTFLHYQVIAPTDPGQPTGPATPPAPTAPVAPTTPPTPPAPTPPPPPQPTPGAPPEVTTAIGADGDPAAADPLVWLPMRTADGGTVLVKGHWYPGRGVQAYQSDNQHIPSLRALIEGGPR